MKERKSTMDFILYEAEYEKVKNDIFFELAEYKRNRKALKEIPFHRNHNLMIRYRLLVDRDEHDFKSFLITKALLRIWGISEQELFKLAMKNTKRLFPPRFLDTERTFSLRLGQLVIDKDKEKETTWKRFGWVRETDSKETERCHLYFLTNQAGFYGAGVILYQSFIQKNIERFHLEGHYIYLLPVSIDEIVLFACRKPIKRNVLKQIVKKMFEQVPVKERFTKRIYCYDWRKKRIREITRHPFGAAKCSSPSRLTMSLR